MKRASIATSRSWTMRLLALALCLAQGAVGIPIVAQGQRSDNADRASTLPERVKPNRTVPNVTRPDPVLVLPAFPTNEELTRAHIFSEPLVPLPRHETSREENAALARAILMYRDNGKSERVGPLTEFLARYPDSAWRPSLLANLGTVYRANGYLARALTAWERAWDQAKGETEPRMRGIAEYALGEFLDLSGKVGHAEELSAKLTEVKDRNVSGRATQKVGMAREALYVFESAHDQAVASGPVALQAILARNATDAGIRPAPNDILLSYHAMPAGTSLLEMKALAKRVGLSSYDMLLRPKDAPIPVPSVVHWRLNHYSAVVKRDGQRYLLLDPVLGGEKWVSYDALNDETSGYVLAPRGAVTTAWKTVADKDASTVIGHCAPGAPDDSDPGMNEPPGPPPPPEPPEDAPPPPPNPPNPDPPCGMPAYALIPMTASLRLEDIPLRCHSPIGPATAFRMTYNQRDGNQSQGASYGNLGPKWTFDWQSWVSDDPTSADVQADVYLRGGGGERYTLSTGGVYPAHWRSGAVLVKVSASPVRYERRLRDGGVEVFTQSDGVITTGRHIYLTDVIDAQGLSLHLTYDSSLRLVAVTDAIGLVTTLSYDLSSDPLKITKVTDPYGRFAQLAYNVAGQLASVTDVIGMTSSFGYGPSDFVASLTTPYGTTLFVHENSGGNTNNFRSLQATDPMGGTERVEFRWQTTAVASTAPSGQVPTGFSARNHDLDRYNSLYWGKRVMALYGADVSKATILHWRLYEFDTYLPWFWAHGFSTSVLSSFKTPLENRVWYAYPNEDSGGTSVGSWVLAATTARVLDDGTTQAWQATYNAHGYPTSVTDPLNRITTYSYASNGIDLLQVRQTTGGANDLLLSATSYTSGHRPQSITDAAGQTTTLTYNAASQVLTVTNAKSETTTFAYDTDGYLQSVTGAISGATTAFTYDAYGRVQTVTGSDGYAMTTAYDALDRPTSVTYPDGTADHVVYARLDAEQVQDRLGRTTRIFHDALGRVTAVRDPLGRTTTQQWCACGSLDALVDAKGQATTWERDVQGRATREVRADGTTATVYAYETTTSRLKTVTDPKAQVTTYTYAADNQLLQQVYTNATVATPTVTFTYDATYGRLSTMVDGTGTTTYTYGSVGAVGAGRLTSVDGPLTNDTLTYGYDELGRVTSRAINSVGLTRTYDALSRLTAETNPLGAFAYAFVGQTGRPDTVTYPNGQTTAYSYANNAGDRRLQTIHHRRADTSTLSKFDYAYDVVGNITSWMRQADSAAATQYVFGYDAADQLVSATRQTTDPTPTIQQRFAYAYDVAGNRSTEQIDDSAVGASYDSLNRLTGQTPSGALRFAGTLNEPASVTIQGTPATVDASNRFSGAAAVTTGTNTVTIAATDGSGNVQTKAYQVTASGSGTTLTYDANGNLTGDGTRSFTWDAVNRLLSVTIGTHVSTFTYDGLSRRVRIVETDGGMTTSDHRFVWCGLELCEERDSTGATVTKRFLAQGVEDGGVDYFYSRDSSGSVRELTDTSGTLRARYDYDPWGRRTKVSGNKDADVGYTGHFEHTPSGLALAPYRAYDANLGRWLSVDPIGLDGGSPNLYGYVNNNPIKRVDPEGLCASDNTRNESPQKNADQPTIRNVSSAPNQNRGECDTTCQLAKDVSKRAGGLANDPLLIPKVLTISALLGTLATVLGPLDVLGSLTNSAIDLAIKIEVISPGAAERAMDSISALTPSPATPSLAGTLGSLLSQWYEKHSNIK